LGYVALAADIYGKGVRPATPDLAGKEAAKYRGKDRSLIRARGAAGLATLAADPHVDPGRLAVMGYCFGGTAALELARSGADIKGAVSFHGGLDTPDPADAKKIRGKVLALHGADDPYVPPAQVAAFQDEMRQAKVDWEIQRRGAQLHQPGVRQRSEQGRGLQPGSGPALLGRDEDVLRRNLRNLTRCRRRLQERGS